MVMAQMWTPKDPEILKSWVQAIIDEASDDLNMWETKFIADMERLLQEGRTLTEAQESKLESIYGEKTP
jgi:hypothetical protein